MATALDLRTAYPRSPNTLMAGLVSLARTTDKSRANDAGTLGEYHFDCPHDKPLFAFLGVSADTFASRVRELGSDEKIEAWVRDELLAGKSPAEIAAFNADRRAWRPDPGTPSAAFFDDTLRRVGNGRHDITTWFDLLDLEEGRPVTAARS